MNIKIISICIVFLSILFPMYLFLYIEGYKGSNLFIIISNVLGIISSSLLLVLALVPAKRVAFPVIAIKETINFHRIIGFFCVFCALVHVVLFIGAEPLSARYLTTYAPFGMTFGLGALVFLLLILGGSYSFRNISKLYKSRKFFKITHLILFGFICFCISIHVAYCNFSTTKKILIFWDVILLNISFLLSCLRLNESKFFIKIMGLVLFFIVAFLVYYYE